MTPVHQWAVFSRLRSGGKFIGIDWFSSVHQDATRGDGWTRTLGLICLPQVSVKSRRDLHQSGLSSPVGNENQLVRRSAESRWPLYRMHVTGSPRDSKCVRRRFSFQRQRIALCGRITTVVPTGYAGPRKCARRRACPRRSRNRANLGTQATISRWDAASAQALRHRCQIIGPHPTSRLQCPLIEAKRSWLL